MTTQLRSLIEECLNQMFQDGLSPIDQQLSIDGKIHRYSCRPEQTKDVAEWYVGHTGISPKGNDWLIVKYGSWRLGNESFVYRSSSKDNKEREAVHRAQTIKIQSIKKDLESAHYDSQKMALKIWEKAIPAHNHPYLELKKVHAHDIRIGQNLEGKECLILPLRDVYGKLHSLQFISSQFPYEKRYLSGGKKKGNFHVIGDLRSHNKCYVCEGYATGATIFEIMQIPTVIAYDCVNLDAVVTELRKHHPTIQINVCADNDRHKEKNAGLEAARAIFEKHRVRYCYPVFSIPGDKGTDFNDLFVSEGADATRKQLFLDCFDEVVYELNQKHTLEAGANHYVIEHLLDGSINFIPIQSFKNRYLNQKVNTGDKQRPSKATVWLNHPHRNTVTKVVFSPHKKCPPEHLNLWTGFAYEAIPGDSQFFWDHVREVICDSNEESYTYVRKWIATVFQRPEILHTALIVMGSQGTGKSIFTQTLGSLLGKHYLTVDSWDKMLGRFNSHLQSIILLNANEAFWASDKEGRGALKAMITEERCAYEGKGQTIREDQNFKHLIITTNESCPAHMDLDDRRMIVLKVSDKRKNDHEYFKRYTQSLKNGGYEAILYDILNEDISDFNPRLKPQTSESSQEAVFQIKLESAGHLAAYIHEVLNSGYFDCYLTYPKQPWGMKQKDEIFQCYLEWAARHNIRNTKNKVHFFRTLHSTIPSIAIVQLRLIGGERTRFLEVPNLEKAKKEFENSFVHNFSYEQRK